ncbi:Glu/Leu/Phe/Val dehydrogenase [Chlamydia sp. 17-3921]|uniref:Glu/Leu/Phe/Val dehydrogenase family protein n=1 Tax=Chlamydia sp. 17-3921 TaxID=2675798 RepID=UPI001917FB7C|nr:Glu/Leu/Phe/Val dehydrogenase [Chlamydia sp. 17-3921]
MKYPLVFKDIKLANYERVIEITCDDVGLHAIIAIHQTIVGPALGGTRASVYGSFDEALTDALRLSKGMSYKSIICGAGTGGGKSVILLPPHAPRLSEDMLRAFGQAVDSLKGKYICAEDLGVSVRDIAIVAEETPYVCGLDSISGNPSIYTAHGVFLCMQETAQKLWGSPSLRYKKVAIQGIGSVGKLLLHSLFFAGAEIYVSDIEEAAVNYAEKLYGAIPISESDFVSFECDILSPCARGNVIRKDNIANLRCKAIVGAANNILEDASIGASLHERGIVYAPDYLINAGGLLNVVTALEESYNPKKVLSRVEKLPCTLRELYDQSDISNSDTVTLSDLFVEERLAALSSS